VVSSILFLWWVDVQACIAYLLGSSNALEVAVDEDADAIAQLLSLLHGMCCDTNVRQIYAERSKTMHVNN